MKATNVKFHGNPSSGKCADTCGRTDGRTDMTKMISTFFLQLCQNAEKFKLHSGGSYSKRSVANSGTLLIIVYVLFVRRRVPKLLWKLPCCENVWFKGIRDLSDCRF